jgi:hypothetical protein
MAALIHLYPHGTSRASAQEALGALRAFLHSATEFRLRRPSLAEIETTLELEIERITRLVGGFEDAEVCDVLALFSGALTQLTMDMSFAGRPLGAELTALRLRLCPFYRASRRLVAEQALAELLLFRLTGIYVDHSPDR